MINPYDMNLALCLLIVSVYDWMRNVCPRSNQSTDKKFGL